MHKFKHLNDSMSIYDYYQKPFSFFPSNLQTINDQQPKKCQFLQFIILANKFRHDSLTFIS